MIEIANSEKKAINLLIIGISFLFSFLLLISLTHLNRSSNKLQSLFLIPFGFYLLGIYVSKTVQIEQRKYLFTIILIALLVQISLLLTEISLSDDIYRFFLEGWAVNQGLNPYHTPIGNLSSILPNPELLEKANHINVTSPYPPLALLIFAILSFFTESINIFRLTFSGAFLLSIIAMYKILPLNHQWKIIIYAWNPLLHMETANGVHFEPLIILPIIVAVWALEREHKSFASILFLLAFLLKYFAIFLFPIFWKRLDNVGRGIIIIGSIFYILWALIDPQLYTGLLVYATDWYFNASIFWIIFQLNMDIQTSKIIAGLIFLILIFLLTKQANKSTILPYKQAYLIIGAFILLQPTFHPWYIFWIFPFILLDNEKINLSWIILTGSLILSYHVYIQFDSLNIWLENDWIRILEFVPFYVILIGEHWRWFTNKIHLIFRKFNQSPYLMGN
ncbi:hypothetical protein [Candidatus Hodarchaeum mangrovi]